MTSRELEILHIRIKAYEKAINNIDDYFEYSNESLKDRIKVQSILSDLCKDIKEEIQNATRTI